MSKQKKQSNDTVPVVSLFSMVDITNYLCDESKEKISSDGRVSGRKTRNTILQSGKSNKTFEKDTVTNLIRLGQDTEDIHKHTTDSIGSSTNTNHVKGTVARRAKDRKTEDGSKGVDNESIKVSNREQETQNSTTEVHGTVRKRRHKFITINSLPPKMTFTGKPKPVKDDTSLVDIEVGDEIFRVSRWSIRDGMYCPGFDSNFLVKFYSSKK